MRVEIASLLCSRGLKTDSTWIHPISRASLGVGRLWPKGTPRQVGNDGNPRRAQQSGGLPRVISAVPL